MEVHLSVVQHPRTDASIRNRTKVEEQRRKRRSFVVFSAVRFLSNSRKSQRASLSDRLFVGGTDFWRIEQTLSRENLQDRRPSILPAWEHPGRSLGVKFSLRWDRGLSRPNEIYVDTRSSGSAMKSKPKEKPSTFFSSANAFLRRGQDTRTIALHFSLCEQRRAPRCLEHFSFRVPISIVLNVGLLDYEFFLCKFIFLTLGLCFTY